MTSNTVTIGSYTLTEDTIVRVANYETASWWTNEKVSAGTYDVIGELDDAGRVIDTTVRVFLPSTIVGAYFGPYDQSDRTGRGSRVILRPYAHALAWGIIRHDDAYARYALSSSYAAIVVPFVYNGQQEETAHIVRTHEHDCAELPGTQDMRIDVINPHYVGGSR